MSDYESDQEPDKKRRKASKCRESDVIYDKLHSNHADTYSVPQLRVIHCGTRADYEEPPRVPMITGTLPKRVKRDTFTKVLTGTAEAVARTFTPQNTPAQSSSCGTSMQHTNRDITWKVYRVTYEELATAESSSSAF